jgi:hypothetical protein
MPSTLKATDSLRSDSSRRTEGADSLRGELSEERYRFNESCGMTYLSMSQDTHGERGVPTD